jgi:hypothetical protein
MLQSDIFDADHFFSKGWVATRVSPDLADKALAFVEKQNFRVESALKSENPQIPDWDSPTSKKTSDNQAPLELIEFWNQLLEHQYFDFWRLIYGEFSQTTVLAHKHRKGVRLPFHNDVHEGLHVTNCLFLTHSNWTKEHGGNMEFGRWVLDSKWWGVENSVVKTGEVIAQHGVLVSICNVIPTFCHGISETLKDETRYTLISRCGYAENIRGNRLSVLF